MRHIPQSHKFFYHQNGTRSVKGGWRMDVDIDDSDSELEYGVNDQEN